MKIKRTGYLGNMGIAFYAKNWQMRLVRHQFALWLINKKDKLGNTKSVFNFSF